MNESFFMKNFLKFSTLRNFFGCFAEKRMFCFRFHQRVVCDEMTETSVIVQLHPTYPYFYDDPSRQTLFSLYF